MSEQFFDDWLFPAIEDELDEVPHAVAKAVIGAARVVAMELFDAMKAEGAWNLVASHRGERGTRLWWLSDGKEDGIFETGFPVTIELRPADLVAAFKDHGDLGTDEDAGDLDDEIRQEMQEMLTEWRAAVDQMEQVLKAASPCVSNLQQTP